MVRREDAHGEVAIMIRDEIELFSGPSSARRAHHVVEQIAGGSPRSHHDRARILVEAAMAQFEAVRDQTGWTSTRRRSWRVKGGMASSTRVRPSKSRRDGYQPNAATNLRAYLLSVVLEMTDAEIARELELKARQNARAARLQGARLAPSLAGGFR